MRFINSTTRIIQSYNKAAPRLQSYFWESNSFDWSCGWSCQMFQNKLFMIVRKAWDHMVVQSKSVQGVSEGKLPHGKPQLRVMIVVFCLICGHNPKFSFLNIFNHNSTGKCRTHFLNHADNLVYLPLTQTLRPNHWTGLNCRSTKHSV